MVASATAETFTPHALSVGELRDRAFAMAEKAGVQLKQIYVYPMARWRLANAYASEGNNLLLTDWLLRHLSIREVDAIIGHELAHMKRGHVSKQSWLMTLLWVPPLAWLRWREVFPELAWVVIWFLGSWKVAAWVQAAVSRRHEREADLLGISISGDPEAFVSALQRVDQLNATPHELNPIEQSVATHPSTRKRIEAIAKAVNLKSFPICQPPSLPASETNHYALPAAVEAATHGDGPVFDSTLKQKVTSRFTGAYLLTVSVPPVILAWIAMQCPSTATKVSIWVTGLAVYVGLIVFVTDRAGRKLQSRLRARIFRKLSERFGEIPQDAQFVGLSPGAEVRLFEGCYSWDLGFIWLEPARLRYVGEQTSFTLTWAQIRHIRLGPGAPRWRRTQRVYLDWDESDSGESGTLSLSCAGESSFSADGRAASILASRLERWPQAPVETKPNLEPQQLPKFGQVTSTCPRHALRFQQYILVLLMALALPIGLIAGAGFHRTNLITAGLTILAVIGGHTFASVPGWRLNRTGVTSHRASPHE